MKNRVALLVHACDRYQFLYRGFEIAFKEYCPQLQNVNFYFATECIDYQIDNFSAVKSGKGEWSNRLRYLLEHKVVEDYVIYMQEDMWLLKPVNAEILNELIEYASNKNLDCIKLHSADIYRVNPTDQFFGGLNLGRIINQESKYLMSHQITLWKKSFLISQLGKDEHPWRNERRATKRLRVQNAVLHQIDFFSENGSSAINTCNTTDDNRSMYYTVSVNAVLNDAVKRYFELLKDKDPVYLAEIVRHHEHNLTHDGKPKPRKDDFVKKIKNWIKSFF